MSMGVIRMGEGGGGGDGYDHKGSGRRAMGTIRRGRGRWA